jgi:hypothetical protein
VCEIRWWGFLYRKLILLLILLLSCFNPCFDHLQVISLKSLMLLKCANKPNSMACVREWTIPTKRPPLVGEVSASFFAGCHVVSVTNPYRRIIGFVGWSCYISFQVASQLYSGGWVDPVTEPLLFFSCGARESNVDLWICRQELWPLHHRGGHFFLTNI